MGAPRALEQATSAESGPTEVAAASQTPEIDRSRGSIETSRRLPQCPVASPQATPALSPPLWIPSNRPLWNWARVCSRGTVTASRLRAASHCPHPSMASTYALPLNPAAQSHSHGHSRSHNFSERRPSWNGSINSTSPAKSQSAHSHSHNGHAHHLSEVHGQVPISPYANGHDHYFEPGHDQSRSIDSALTLKPFMGRPRGRPRGESDLGRPPSRKSATTGKFGFSPIQETQAPPPPP